MTAQHRSWEDSAVQNAYPDYYPLFRCIAGPVSYTHLTLPTSDLV